MGIDVGETERDALLLALLQAHDHLIGVRGREGLFKVEGCDARRGYACGRCIRRSHKVKVACLGAVIAKVEDQL